MPLACRAACCFCNIGLFNRTGLLTLNPISNLEDQGFCSQCLLPLDWLPTNADEPDLPGFYIRVFLSQMSCQPRLSTLILPVFTHSWGKDDECQGMSTHRGPTHCISEALAVPRSPSIQPEILDPSYPALPRGGIKMSRGSAEALYWQGKIYVFYFPFRRSQLAAAVDLHFDPCHTRRISLPSGKNHQHTMVNLYMCNQCGVLHLPFIFRKFLTTLTPHIIAAIFISSVLRSVRYFLAIAEK